MGGPRSILEKRNNEKGKNRKEPKRGKRRRNTTQQEKDKRTKIEELIGLRDRRRGLRDRKKDY